MAVHSDFAVAMPKVAHANTFMAVHQDFRAILPSKIIGITYKMRAVTVLLFVLALCAHTFANQYTLTATQNGKLLGVIRFQLLPNVAPKHAAFVAARIAEGFYNGSAFHRVIPGFIIQGGDPNSISGPRETWGYGGHSQKVQAEFSNTKHVRGTISAARTSDPNSFSGQFFICVATAEHLDGQYTVFGQVLSGMEVADIIVNSPRDANNNPREKISMTIVPITSNVLEAHPRMPVSVFPQPARSTLVVSVEHPSNIAVMDLNGSVVHTMNVHAGVHTLPVGMLACGTYVFAVQSAVSVEYVPVMITGE